MSMTWESCKQKIRELPLNPNVVIKEMLVKHPERVYKKVEGKGYRITVKLRALEAHEVFLEYIEKDGEPIRSMYTIYDGKNSNCFMRDLLVEDPTNL